MTITASAFRFVTPRKVTDDRENPDGTTRKGLAWDDPRIAGFRWIFKRLQAGQTCAPQVTLRHGGTCGRCGRALTTPASLDTGIGPVCADKMGIPHGEGQARGFDPLPYILAGHATITATSERTGTRYTYRIARANPRAAEGEAEAEARESAPEPEGPLPYFVSVLTGPDNTADYRWIGMLFPE